MKKSISKSFGGRPIGTGKGKKVNGTNIRLTGTKHGEDPKLVVHLPEQIDLEETLPTPDDSLSRHKYPPPKKNPIFRKVWGQFIDGIVGRDNFSVAHLNSLEVLCDLFTEYKEISTFLRKKGRSYQTFGRSGMSWKFYPEVGQLKSVQHLINVYMKQLGLVLKRDDIGGVNEGLSEWK